MGKYDKFKGLIPTFKEALADLKREYAEYDESALLAKFTELKEEKKEITEQLKEIERELTAITEVLVEEMEARDLTQLKNSKLGTFSVRTNIFVTQKDKSKLLKWLKRNGYEDLIKDHVNPKVLNSLFSEMLVSGSLPNDAGVEVFLKSNITNTSIKQEE